MTAISSTFDSQEPLMGDLLKDIHTGKLQLPDFQRPWVWDDNHIRSLLASVSLSYPIGAIMILQTGDSDVVFLPRPVKGVQLKGSVLPDRLILDGQQRLTSLYGALWSKKPVSTKNEKQKQIKRWYYLDIKKCLNPQEDRLDAILSIPEDKCLRSNFGRKIELDLNTCESEYINSLVPMNIMLGIDFDEWRTGYMEYHQWDNEYNKKIMKFGQEVWMRFQQFKIPVIQLLNKTPKEAVCQVFEKVNTGGVALSVFELLTATFAADNFQLRNDWDQRKEILHEHDVLQAVDGTEYLQVVTLLANYNKFLDNGKALSVKRRDVLNLTLEEYKANVDTAEAGLLNAARLLSLQKVFDLKNLPYGTQLVPLGAVCGYIGDRFEEERVRAKLVQWYWCGIFGEMYGGANETRYAMDVQDLIMWIINSESESRTIRDADFSPMRLLTLQSRLSAAYKGLFALMVKKGSRDFMNGDPISHTNGFDLPVDIHHIFPKAWCKESNIKKQLWNSVINKAPLTSRTNKILSGSAPNQYINRILNKKVITELTLQEILKSHFIEPEYLKQDDFYSFLRERARKLLDAIEEAMGKRIQGRDSEEVRKVFGESL